MMLGNAGTRATIFLGNPGCGKSTLLNALLGRAHFASGRCYGTGLTTRAEALHLEDGSTLVDTPGLADIGTRQEAGAQITQALSAGWAGVRVVLVASLRAGRVMPDDVATLRCVLGAVAPTTPLSFAVVLNALEPPVCEHWKQSADFRTIIENAFLSGLERRTTHFLALPLAPELAGKNNALAPAPLAEQLRDFVAALPYAPLPASSVSAVDTTTLESMREALELELEETTKALERMEAEHAARLGALEAETARALSEQSRIGQQHQQRFNAEQRARDAHLARLRSDRERMARQLQVLADQRASMEAEREQYVDCARRNVATLSALVSHSMPHAHVHDHPDVVAARAELESTVARWAAALQPVVEQHHSMREQLAAMDSSLADLDAQLARLRRDVDAQYVLAASNQDRRGGW